MEKVQENTIYGDKDNIKTSYSAGVADQPNWYIYEYVSERKILVEVDPNSGKVQFLKNL